MEEHGGKIKNTQAVELHNSAGSLTADKVKDILVGDTKEKPVSDAKMFAQIKKKYFKGKSTDEIRGILEQALTTWFTREGGSECLIQNSLKKSILNISTSLC